MASHRAVGPTVGVLALQGDFEEHLLALEDVGVAAAPVRTAEQLARVGALILPGGESTSVAKLMDAYDLREPLRGFARAGKPVWGTCAGLILLAERLVEGLPEPLGLMDMLVRRNGFGRQVDSFETDVDVAGLDGGPFHAVFIRAPAVVETGPAVEVLARLDDGTVVAARQGNLIATAFHPELTTDRRLHARFAAMLLAEVAR